MAPGSRTSRTRKVICQPPTHGFPRSTDLHLLGIRTRPKAEVSPAATASISSIDILFQNLGVLIVKEINGSWLNEGMRSRIS
jgi:hypothetical protein